MTQLEKAIQKYESAAVAAYVFFRDDDGVESIRRACKLEKVITERSVMAGVLVDVFGMSREDVACIRRAAVEFEKEMDSHGA